MNKKISLGRISAFTLIGFSGIYLSGITQFSPIYFGLILSTILFLPVITIGNNSINRVLFSSIILFLSILGNSIYFDKVYESRNWLVSYFIFILGFLVLQRLNLFFLKKITYFFIKSSILLLVLECFLRFYNPDLNSTVNDTWNNKYKLNSIMFTDSNTVGLYINCLFFFLYYLKERFRFKLKIEMFLLFILCILTFSKGAIGTILLTLIIFRYWLIIKRFKQIIICAIVPIVGGIVYAYTFLASNFASLQQRINILYSFLDYIKKHPDYLIFGGGPHSSIELIGRGSHILFLVLITGLGVFGLFLFLHHLFIINKYSNKKAYYLIVPFLINGLLFGEPMSYFFVPLLLLYYFEQYKNEPNIE
jgi:hypothetical protein